MPVDPKFNLRDQTAEEVYTSLVRDRQPVEDLARELAGITIPSVFLPQEFKSGDDLEGTHQSINALAVNNLASNLMFMAMPPGRPMMRFEIMEHRLSDEDKAADPELQEKIDLALSLLEQAHRRRAETTSMRSAYTGAMKQLLVAGNVLWDHSDIDSPVFHDLTRYVVKRDAFGNQLLVILKSTVALASLPQDVKELVLRDRAELKDKPEWEEEVDIYKVMKLNTDPESGEKTWLSWEEFEGEAVDGTELESDFDQPPMLAAWLIPVYGQDWGRSYADEYRGDLYAVETLAESLTDGAAIASLTYLFVRPGARVSVRQIRGAENLSVHTGAAEDITAFNLREKMADYQFIANSMEQAGRRIGRAFLMHFVIQRDAERVTAEEIARLATELDKAMGGIYSELAQSFQRFVMRRFVALHEDDDPNLPELPESIVKIGVVTGIDSLGRAVESQSLVRIGTTLNSTFGPQAASSIMNITNFARRLAASEGVQPRGLFRTEEEITEARTAESQRETRQALIERGTGPVAGEAAKAFAPPIAEALAAAAGGGSPQEEQ